MTLWRVGEARGMCLRGGGAPEVGGEAERGAGTLMEAPTAPKSNGSEANSPASRRPLHTGESERKPVTSWVGESVCRSRICVAGAATVVDAATAAVGRGRIAGRAVKRMRWAPAKYSFRSLSVLALLAGASLLYRNRLWDELERSKTKQVLM